MVTIECMDCGRDATADTTRGVGPCSDFEVRFVFLRAYRKVSGTDVLAAIIRLPRAAADAGGTLEERVAAAYPERGSTGTRRAMGFCLSCAAELAVSTLNNDQLDRGANSPAEIEARRASVRS